jgi:hypothetical protein
MAEIKKPTPEDRRRDGKLALVEQRAEADAVNKNMARLRALRLEREANTPVPTKVVKKSTKKKAGSLSQYLKNEKDTGRGT